MKKLVMSALILLYAYLMPTSLAIAQPSPDEQNLLQQTSWASTDSNDNVEIQNGAGLPILVVITVSAKDPNATGANIQNCGTTTHVDPGSSVVCATQDPNNPVTISSDSASKSTSGTYQIKQQ